jgi:hypothetical protein
MDGEGPARLKMETPSASLDFKLGAWTRPSDVVEIQELVARAPSSIEAALMLARRENQIAGALQAENTVFTMILGPESETAEGAEVVRRFRVAAVRGVYRATPRLLVPATAKDTAVRKFNRHQREVIRL